MNEIFEGMQNADAFVRAGSLWAWIFAISISIVLSVLIRVILMAVLVRLEKITERTPSRVDNILVAAAKATKSWVIFVWIMSAFIALIHPAARILEINRIIFVIATGTQVCFWGIKAIRYWRRMYLNTRVTEDLSSVAAIGLLCTALQGLLIVIVTLIGLSNLGVDVAALVAGLGVGGIAVALAAQNILGDLLASLSIILDKPFVVGDFIIVGSELGTVENIGIKTTRVRSLSGEELVFSNKDLLESRIRNYKRMWERRVVQKFSVTYSTSVELLDQIPKWVREFVESDPKLRFDRCHFSGYGHWSLDFELVFFVKDPDYNVYMDHQQKLLIAIYRKFEHEGIEFALSQSRYIEKMPFPDPQQSAVPVS